MPDLNEAFQAQLKLAEETASFCFWQWDSDSSTITFSSDFCNLIKAKTQVHLSEFTDAIEKYVHPDYVESVKQYFNKVLTNEIDTPIEFILLPEDGIEKHIRAKGHSYYSNKKHRIVGVFHDITEWKMMEQELSEQLNFISTVMETVPNPIFYKDEHSIYKYCNTAFCQYLNLDKSQIIGKNIFDIRSKDLAEIVHNYDLQLKSTKNPLSYKLAINHSDGTDRHVVFNKAPLISKRGSFKGIVGAINDITEQMESENQVKRLMKMKDAVLKINHSVMEKQTLDELFDVILEQVFLSMDLADIGCILLLDENNTLTIAASTGYDTEDAKAYHIQLEESYQWKKSHGDIKDTIVINDLNKEEDMPPLLDNSTGLKIQSTISTPIIIDNKLYGFLSIDSSTTNAFDEADWAMIEYLRSQLEIAISKFKLYEHTIFLSERDPITGFYNRRHFEELFHISKERALRYEEKFLVILFDLNELKHINDTYGHLAGDEYILYFAKTLKNEFRSSDILSRYGGDEFIALVFNTDADSIKNRLNSLRLSFEKNPLKLNGHMISCSFSYGIAELPSDGTNYDKLVEIADRHMYTYKSNLKAVIK